MENAGIMPASIISGETIAVEINKPYYTAAGGYTITYQFAAAAPVVVSAVADGALWALTVTAAQTLLWRPGSLRFAGMATHTASGVVTAFDAGAITVSPSPMAASEYAAALTAIDAAIANYATNPRRSFALGSMSVTYASLHELLDLRAFYRAEVSMQTGRRIKRIIRARFT